MINFLSLDPEINKLDDSLSLVGCPVTKEVTQLQCPSNEPKY